LRRPTPATITLFTAGALEQGRNGWTHQRPEIEAYFAAMMRNGNVFPLFPTDANSIQACYEWALTAENKGVVITASKSPLPLRTSLAQARQALAQGAILLSDSSAGSGGKQVVFAVIGDMILAPVFAAADQLQAAGIGVKIVSIVNPRRLYRPSDVAWESCSQPDSGFIDDASFTQLFGGDALIGVTGGPSAMLEPIMLRSQARRETFAWQRGETTASPGELMSFNGLTAEALTQRATALLS
jgi:phosphoketolase